MAYCTSYWLALLAFTSLHHIVVASNDKLSLRLIHRHSIFPFRPSQNDDIRAPVLPKKGGALFLVNISIGTPPVPQLLAMDTGSYLIWTRCNCKTCFDPKKSSTYVDVPSNAPPCITLDYGGVSSPSACPFDQRYLDSSFTKGTLAFETYTFGTPSDGTVQVPNAVIGCAHETRPADFGGVLGLIGVTPQHLLSHTGNKFSYCIGNISDTQYEYNQLVLGDGAVTQGDSTPMNIINNFYTVSLIGITVGDVSLRIELQDVIVDSGTTYTHLRKGAYGPLAEQILILAQRFFLVRVKVRNAERNLCYEGDMKGFPIVTLHLEEGVDVNLDVESLFRRTTDGSAYCLTIIESERNILGITAQQFYNVGFDVGAKKISFQRIDCQLLDE